MTKIDEEIRNEMIPFTICNGLHHTTLLFGFDITYCALLVTV